MKKDSQEAKNHFNQQSSNHPLKYEVIFILILFQTLTDTEQDFAFLTSRRFNPFERYTFLYELS